MNRLMNLSSRNIAKAVTTDFNPERLERLVDFEFKDLTGYCIGMTLEAKLQFLLQHAEHLQKDIEEDRETLAQIEEDIYQTTKDQQKMQMRNEELLEQIQILSQEIQKLDKNVSNECVSNQLDVIQKQNEQVMVSLQELTHGHEQA